MSENEAVKAIQNDLEWHSKELKPAYKEVLRFAIQAIEEIQQYRAIGTVEELQALKEKSEPKKPIELDQWGEYYKCPICGKYAVNDFGCKYKFCPNCGTEFDWQ